MEGEEAAPPFEWIVSRVCEEFSCLPSEALRELLDDPNNMALDIIELRAYARTKQQIDDAKKQEDMPSGPMADLVWGVQLEIARRRREEAGR